MAGRLYRAHGSQQKLQQGSRLASSEDCKVVGKAHAKGRRERSQEQRVHAHLVKRSEVYVQKRAALLFRKPILGDQRLTLVLKPIQNLGLSVDVKQELLDFVKTHRLRFVQGSRFKV
jgi:hypothetical protein